MTRSTDKTRHTSIGDVLKQLPRRDVPVVHRHADLAAVVRAMVNAPHSRLLYVIDDEERLMGSISLGALMRHVFVDFHAPTVHSRSMINQLVNETAEHLMRPRPISATRDDTVSDVLDRLIEANVKEFPVIDNQQKIVADLTAVDLIAVTVIDASR